MAEVVVEKVTTYTLVMDEDEAQFLLNLVHRVGGTGPLREICDNMCQGLRDAGLTTAGLYDSPFEDSIYIKEDFS